MFKFVQKYSSSSIVITFILGILLWIPAIINPANTTAHYLNISPFYLFFQKLYLQNPFWANFITIITLILEIFILTDISIKYNIFSKNTLVYALVYTILTGYTYDQFFSPIYIANLFVLPAFLIFVKSIKKQSNPKDFLNISMLFLVASFFYVPYIFMFLFVFLAIPISRIKSSNYFFSVLFALLIFFLLVTELKYLFTGKLIHPSEILIYLKNKNIKFHNNLFEKIYFGIILLLFLIANLHILNRINSKSVENRTFFHLNSLFFFFSILMYLFIPSIGSEFWITISIPLAYLFSEFFANAKDSLANKILFIIFILSPFILKFGIILNS